MKFSEKKIEKLLRFRKRILLPRTVDSIADSLGSVSEAWLKKDYSSRIGAVGSLVRVSGFSEAMAHAMVDALFRELTRKKIKALLKAELCEPRVLDGFATDHLRGTQCRAEGPAVITHIFSANLPNPAVMSLIHGLLVKSVNLVKVSRRDEGIFPWYLESLKKIDSVLADSVLWLDPRDRGQLKKWMSASDLVVAYGSNESIRQLKKTAGEKPHFIGYGHRVSFSLYLKEALNQKGIRRLAAMTARDVWMADQRGCLSPSVVYAQRGGELTARTLARKIADSLEQLGKGAKESLKMRPQRFLDKQKIRAQWKIDRVKGQNACLWESQVPGMWAVFYEEKASCFPLSCGGQTIFVREFTRPEEVYEQVMPLAGFIQAVAVEGQSASRERAAVAISELGASRVTRAGRLQEPPAVWHHDGRPNFSEWLRWTDLE